MATTLNVAVCPLVTVWLAGWVVMAGATGGWTTGLELEPQAVKRQSASPAAVDAVSRCALEKETKDMQAVL